VPGPQTFWWHELDFEIINNEPWAVHTDLSGIDSMWLFHGEGSPGSWTWEVWNVRQLSTINEWHVDTLYNCYTVQYPSITYDEVTGTVLVTAKTYYYRGDDATWADINGAHVGGIYSNDGGANWVVCRPLSTIRNDAFWDDWNATETAHYLVNDGSDIWASTVWIDEIALNMYYEKGNIGPWFGVEEASQGRPAAADFKVAPTVSRNLCYATFNMQRTDNVTLNLFDVSGRAVASVFSGSLQKGEQTLPVSTSAIANGTYFLVLEGTSGKQVAKVVIAH
jgi:hypothetical protein